MRDMYVVAAAAVVRYSLAGYSALQREANVLRPRALQIQGCQMAKFDPFLPLDCARVEGWGKYVLKIWL